MKKGYNKDLNPNQRSFLTRLTVKGYRRFKRSKIFKTVNYYNLNNGGEKENNNVHVYMWLSKMINHFWNLYYESIEYIGFAMHYSFNLTHFKFYISNR